MNISYIDPEKLTHNLILIGRHNTPGFYHVVSDRRGDLSLDFGAIKIDGKRATQEALDLIIKQQSEPRRFKHKTSEDLRKQIGMMSPKQMETVIFLIAQTMYESDEEPGILDPDKQIEGADLVDAIIDILHNANLKAE